MRWPVAICRAHSNQNQISKIPSHLSGAKSVLVNPRQVTTHTSQVPLELDRGLVTAYSTRTSWSRRPCPSNKRLDSNCMGVGHLPRLAQNEPVLRLANHGLVLLGHLLYGLAELHKLCFCPLWSSARRTTDGLSEQLQACCIGGRVHRKTSPKFFEPGLSLKHNCDLSVIMAEVSIGVSSVIPMALLVRQPESFCTAAQLLQEIDQHLSLLVQGLVKARSDAVDGDGAASRLNAWVPWTPELQAAVVIQSSLNSLIPTNDFGLTETQLTDRCTSRASPFRL
jgi:hypothetical protein